MTLDDNQVWLIGSVIRQGSMASKEVDPRRISAVLGKKIMSNDSMRRFVYTFVSNINSYTNILIIQTN